MRLLDRYLLRELLMPLIACVIGFWVLSVSADFLAEVDDYQEQEMTAMDVMEFYAVRTPEFMVTILPIALLLALLHALTSHARHNELTAIRAAGVGMWRLSAPYLGVGILFGAGVFVFNEYWLPAANQRAEEVFYRRVQDRPEFSRWHEQLNFRNSRDDRIWAIGAFHLDTHAMRDPHVEATAPNGAVRVIHAQSAERRDGVWVFRNVQETIYPPGGGIEWETKRWEELAVPEFTETPDQIKSEIKISGLSRAKAARKVQLSLEEIRDYLRLHPDLNEQHEALLRTQFHARLAAPLTCVVVILVALPFGARSGRRNAFVGVAGSVFICFAFMILLKLGLALGTGRFVPPWLGAWMPNAVFSALGVYLVQKIR